MDIILQLRPGQVTADRATFDREKGLVSLDCSDPLQVHLQAAMACMLLRGPASDTHLTADSILVVLVPEKQAA